jgi:hypothetical protein
MNQNYLMSASAHHPQLQEQQYYAQLPPGHPSVPSQYPLYATPEKADPGPPGFQSRTPSTNMCSGVRGNDFQLKRFDSTIDSSQLGKTLLDETEMRVAIAETEYVVHGRRLLTMEEAEAVYNRQQVETQNGYKKRAEKSRTNKVEWSDEEVHLLQWVIFNYASQNHLQVSQFVRHTKGSRLERC